LERNILILSVFDYLYDGTAVTGRQRYDHPEKHKNAVRIEKTVLNEKVQELYGQDLLPVLYTPRKIFLKPAVKFGGRV
jgi:hypothetical protein